ncbi:protein phosphatase 2c [Dorcoceras hygrometricum]|nr:protein phosphatase 2c [Dorcoceras hygrometricum]
MFRQRAPAGHHSQIESHQLRMRLIPFLQTQLYRSHYILRKHFVEKPVGSGHDDVSVAHELPREFPGVNASANPVLHLNGVALIRYEVGIPPRGFYMLSLEKTQIPESAMPIEKRKIRRFICKHDPVMSMITGSFYLPKENDSKPLGEDAHFILQEANAIGVADGVGGWFRKGIDSGEYSRELMRNTVAAIKHRRRKGAVDPKCVLHEAFLKTEAKGSSTACVITLDGRTLRAVNVGDSGFLVIRGGKIVYTSPTQQRKFNHPYQLGKTSRCDTPDVAEEIAVAVEIGDVIVAATDGLFDNMFPDDIEQVVRLCLEEDHNEPELVAWTLAKVARQNSLDITCTPFEAAASEAGFVHFGGKYDDVTVVVAYVVPAIGVLL